MSDVKIAYGANDQTITISLGGLADGSLRGAAAVDNSTNLYMDAKVGIAIKTGASGGDATDRCIVYVSGSSDGGSTYEGEYAGSNAAVNSDRNLRMLGIVECPAATTTFYKEFDVAAAFGGVMPDHWGIVVENDTGAALDGTDGNHDAHYQGVYATVS